jgi:hypothetical protein
MILYIRKPQIVNEAPVYYVLASTLCTYGLWMFIITRGNARKNELFCYYF